MSDGLRIDKYLWHTRLVKTRSLAQRLCEAGLVLINDKPTPRAATPVKPTDHVRLTHAGWCRTIEVLVLGIRRGPAEEARTLYRQIAAEPAAKEAWEPLLADEED